jgi:hypothetical protein
MLIDVLLIFLSPASLHSEGWGAEAVGCFGWLQDVRSLVYTVTSSPIRSIKIKVSEIPASIASL